MDLKRADVAKLLCLPEEQVEKWALEGTIPSYKIAEELRFNRSEVEEWMIRPEGQKLLSEIQTDVTGLHNYSFYRALNRGEIFRTAQKSKEGIIQETVAQMAETHGWNGEVLTDLLLKRERLASTAMGHGVAIPHAREFLLKEHYDVVGVTFLEEPIDFGGLSGEPVHTLFFLFACEDGRHLELLSKIAHFVHNPVHQQLLKCAPSRKTLMDKVKDWEGNLRGK